MTAERLQKLMAAAGVGSRRKCEVLIANGHVQVNGRTVTELGAKADPGTDRISVDGNPLEMPTRHSYYKVHKPRGVLSDVGGDMGERRTVLDLLPSGAARVYPVGRLDLHSEGLVLMTDDGDLAHRLTHPRFEHPKTYYVLVEKRPPAAALAQLRDGIDLPDGRTSPATVEVVQKLPEELALSKGPTEGVWLCIVLREGKKRQIRHMTAAVGHPTLRLVRWAIGPLTLGKLALGQVAPLTRHEVNLLRSLVGLEKADSAPARRSTRGRPGKRPTPRTTGGDRNRSPRSATGHKGGLPRRPRSGAGTKGQKADG